MTLKMCRTSCAGNIVGKYAKQDFLCREYRWQVCKAGLPVQGISLASMQGRTSCAGNIAGKYARQDFLCREYRWQVCKAMCCVLLILGQLTEHKKITENRNETLSKSHKHITN
jgi:hypothetical protein